MFLVCLGFMLVFGAVGGMDSDVSGQYFASQLVLAVLGLVLMYVGTAQLNNKQ